MRKKSSLVVATMLAVTLSGLAGAAAKGAGGEVDNVAPESAAACTKYQLPKTDGKPADMSKPVKVFVMMGQSNMVGMAPIDQGKGVCPLTQAVKTQKLYQFLLDETGNWAERKDVRNVFVMDVKNSMSVLHNEWLKVGAGMGKGKAKMGTEYGIGWQLGNAIDAPVMLLKSCIGNRSLGWDLLPPGSKGYDFGGDTYASYKESPLKWPKGSKPESKPGGWYAGLQYDHDVANAKKVLSELDKYYPGAKGYEIAGFFWWQGDKDRGDAGHASHYEENLVHLIDQLRKDFNAPNAPFVIATLGQDEKGDKNPRMANDMKILEAMLDVDGNSGKYPQFKGNVATVYSHLLSLGGASNSHYNGDSRTYMNVGLAMGEAMANLLKN